MLLVVERISGAGHPRATRLLEAKRTSGLAVGANASPRSPPYSRIPDTKKPGAVSRPGANHHCQFPDYMNVRFVSTPISEAAARSPDWRRASAGNPGAAVPGFRRAM